MIMGKWVAPPDEVPVDFDGQPEEYVSDGVELRTPAALLGGAGVMDITEDENGAILCHAILAGAGLFRGALLFANETAELDGEVKSHQGRNQIDPLKAMENSLAQLASEGESLLIAGCSILAAQPFP